MTGDPASLARMVRNLADNAARHARGRVALGVRVGCGADGLITSNPTDGEPQHGDVATVFFDDDGRGIPVADRERVFERFTRLDEGRTRSAGGAGLGLALVRSVALAHGGVARVVDAPVLGGARFEVVLPISPAARS